MPEPDCLGDNKKPARPVTLHPLHSLTLPHYTHYFHITLLTHTVPTALTHTVLIILISKSLYSLTLYPLHSLTFPHYAHYFRITLLTHTVHTILTRKPLPSGSCSWIQALRCLLPSCQKVKNAQVLPLHPINSVGLAPLLMLPWENPKLCKEQKQKQRSMVSASLLPLQGVNPVTFTFSCWEILMDRGDWWAAVHGAQRL